MPQVLDQPLLDLVGEHGDLLVLGLVWIYPDPHAGTVH